MSLAAQIIDQRVSGIVEEQSETFDNELRLGTDEGRRRSIAFLFLVAKAAFDLTDDQTIDGIVDGGNDFGIDALYFQPPADGDLQITLIQGKYRRDLGGDSAFPENDIARMIDAVGTLFDPARPVQLNRRLNERIEDIRSFVKDGAIPRVTAVAANNGARWTAQAEQRIDNAAKEFGEQVEWRHTGADELLALLQARKPIDADLKLTGAATVESFDFRRVLTGRMSVAELARLTDRYDKFQASYYAPSRTCDTSFGCCRRSRNRFPGWATGSGPVGGSKSIVPLSSARTARSTPWCAKRLAVAGCTSSSSAICGAVSQPVPIRCSA